MAGNASSQGEIRQLAEARRRALPAESIEALGGEIQAHLVALRFFKAPCTVAIYRAQGFEVPLVRLHQSLHAAGHRVALPRVERRGEPLTFHLLAPEGPWVRSRYGLDEPGPEVPSLPLPQIDVWVVPGTAFTPAGGRLGRGGGFYDRTLAAARPDAVKVGVCFGCQMFDTLPLAPHDVRMNLVVTERGPLTNATAGCY